MQSEQLLSWAPEVMHPLIRAAISTAAATPGVIGLMIGGSAVSSTMDRFSDLDLVVICRDEAQPQLLEQAPAFAAKLGPLLTAFPGEHVGEPRLVICLYGPPLLHVDLKLVAERDLADRYEDGRILWEQDGAVTKAQSIPPPTEHPVSVQWIEDRFWTWVHYGATKIGRGELFECIDHLTYLRNGVLGPLISQQRGRHPNGVRRLEQVAPDLVDVLASTIGNHTTAGCVAAMRATIGLYRQLRDEYPDLRRYTEAEAAAVAFLDELTTSGNG
jgi:predicted nucleotidyltransferase